MGAADGPPRAARREKGGLKGRQGGADRTTGLACCAATPGTSAGLAVIETADTSENRRKVRRVQVIPVAFLFCVLPVRLSLVAKVSKHFLKVRRAKRES